MGTWYTSRNYYVSAGILGLAVSIGFMVAVLISDSFPSCNDPYGISDRCFSSKDCLEDHCTRMLCEGTYKCVPVVNIQCVLGDYLITELSCPLYKGLYQPIVTIGCILLLVVDLSLFAGTRIYLYCRQNREYQQYPTLLGVETTCSRCGQDVLNSYEDCTTCKGTGMYTGTEAAIVCHVCNGKGHTLKKDAI